MYTFTSFVFHSILQFAIYFNRLTSDIVKTSEELLIEKLALIIFMKIFVYCGE